MHCAACAGVIESAVRGVAGVRARRGSMPRAGALQVRWDPARTRASALVGAVHRAGYRALPARHEDARAALRQGTRASALWRLFVAGFGMMQVMMLTVLVYMAAPGRDGPDLLALLRWAAWACSVCRCCCSPPARSSAVPGAPAPARIGMDVPVALGIASPSSPSTRRDLRSGRAFRRDEPFWTR